MPPTNYRKADSQTTLTSNLSGGGITSHVSHQSAVINGLNNLEPDPLRRAHKDRAMDMEIRQVPWWNRRSRMERRFLVLVVTLLLVSVGLSLALAGSVYRDRLFGDPQLTGQYETTAAFTAPENGIKQQSRQPDDDNDCNPSNDGSTKHCLTPGCVQTASEILRNMDETVNPCDDFYKFACGGFEARTAIAEDRTRMSSFSVLGDELLTQVSVIHPL